MEIQVGKNIFVKLDEYKGGYSITQGYHDKQGQFKPDFVLTKNFESGEMTDKRAKSVYFGKDEEGIKNLLKFAWEILNLFEERPKGQDIPQQPIDDVPF